MTEANRYSRLTFVIPLLGCMLLSPFCTTAQFIDLELEVEPKLDARTEQPLDFGVLQAETGRSAISLGDPGMGIFSITAMENHLLLVSLELPDRLRHDNPAVGDIIPLQLYGRYGFSADNPTGSRLLSDGQTVISVEESPEAGPWGKLYLFIFGSVDIGSVSDGVYTGQVVLHVEYI